MDSPVTYLRPLQRPEGGVNTSDLLCSFLLPLSLLASASQQDISVISVSLALSSCMVYILDYRSTGPSATFSWLMFLPAWCSLILLPAPASGSRFRLYLCFWTVLLYRPLFNRITATFKKSFTFGEACIVTQGLLLTLFSVINRLSKQESYRSVHLAKQVAKFLDWLMIHCRNETSLALISSWVVLAVLSVVVVIVYKHRRWPVTTITRKIFHLSVLLVYIPGLLYDPILLYVASIGATTIFVILELLRWSERLPVLTGPLSSYLKHFADQKEGGSLILTNIYLLVGVSLPLWVWPRDISVPAPLPLYAGLISVGVGDAASSIVGTLLGRTRWSGSNKTLEGALAGFLSQLMTGLYICHVTGVCLNLSLYSAVCLVTSLVELVLEQVDNLVLPLVMYTGIALIQDMY